MRTSSFLQCRVARPFEERGNGLQVCFLRSVDAPEVQQTVHPQPVHGIDVDPEDGSGLLRAQQFDRCSVHDGSFQMWRASGDDIYHSMRAISQVLFRMLRLDQDDSCQPSKDSLRRVITGLTKKIWCGIIILS